VVVARAANFAIGTVTDNGGNTYTQQVSYSGSLPNIAIFTCLAQSYASYITCHWTAGCATAITVTLYNGVGSIGTNKGSASGLSTSTSESITCTLASVNNWAVVGMTHSQSGGAPTSTSGYLRVTSAGAAGNTYTSMADNTGANSVVCSNSYTNTTTFSAVYIELVPATQAWVQYSLTLGGGGSHTSNFTLTTAGGVKFSNATVAGNLLLCLVQLYASDDTGVVNLDIGVPSTAGISWVLGGYICNTTGMDGSIPVASAVAIYYAANAPSVSASTATTVYCSSSTGKSLNYFIGGCQLMEVCGSNGNADQSSTGTGTSPTSATAGLITTSAVDFVVTNACSGNEAAWNPGTGFYTFLFPYGGWEVQFAISVPALTVVNTSYGTQVDPAYGWSCVAVAFGGTIGFCGTLKPTGVPTFGQIF
jgi:hypothetical protein